MRSSWRHTFRRLAMAGVVAASASWSTACCYAQNSFDNAADPAYADGWQHGDNGGTGFMPWNFDSSWVVAGEPPTWYQYANAEFHAVDDGMQSGTHFSNPHNSLGRTWAMGAVAGGDGTPRAGRGFAPLEIGDRINVVFDNPTRNQFHSGYIIRLNGGTAGQNGNICNQNSSFACTPNTPQPIEQIGLARFEYFNYGEWNVYDSGGKFTTGVTNVQTAQAGALFSVTRTGVNTYDLLLDPLGAGPSATASRTYQGLPIDWIEFVFFNPLTDTSPTLAELGTDLYIRSLEIVRAAPPGQHGDFNSDGKVDAADYVAWRKQDGMSTTVSNDNGLGAPVRPAHYDLWRQHFGEMGNGSGGAGEVPEPGVLSQVIASACIGLAIPRGRCVVKETA